FAATLALLLCVQRLPNVLLRPPSSTRPRWERIGIRAGQGAAVALVVSAAVELVIAPLLLHHFGQLSAVGPIGTVVFLVPVTILQGLALAAAFPIPMLEPITTPSMIVLSKSLLATIVSAGGAAPAPVALAPPNVVVYYSSIFVLWARPTDRRVWSVAALGLLLSFLVARWS
ncbi:MAG TPA: ComEC/Rec2 family competence protein, partial [Candidatus Krumholzibacteria bacterium]|nr:ComEC/Rec2 family competence protein [Candidatus Krumholzibacteria bacterium]